MQLGESSAWKLKLGVLNRTYVRSVLRYVRVECWGIGGYSRCGWRLGAVLVPRGADPCQAVGAERIPAGATPPERRQRSAPAGERRAVSEEQIMPMRDENGAGGAGRGQGRGQGRGLGRGQGRGLGQAAGQALVQAPVQAQDQGQWPERGHGGGGRGRCGRGGGRRGATGLLSGVGGSWFARLGADTGPRPGAGGPDAGPETPR